MAVAASPVFTFSEDQDQSQTNNNASSSFLGSGGRMSRARRPSLDAAAAVAGGASGVGGSGAGGVLTPTKINLSSRGVDEVHPLAMAAISKKKQQLQQQQPLQPGIASLGSTSTSNGRGSSDGNKNSEMSSITSSSKSITSSSNKSKSGGASVASVGVASTSRKDKPMNPKQQEAMDNFLKAQMSGDPIAKNEMWKELVRVMKEGEDNSNSVPYNRQNSGRSRKGASSGKSWSSGKDDILGLVRLGGGLKVGAASDAISIQSGLTSELCNMSHSAKSAKSATSEGMWATGQWNPSPRSSPVRNLNQFANQNVKKQVELKDIFESTAVFDDAAAAEVEGGAAGGDKAVRTVTPPNVPPMLSSGGKPMISPLSIDGSFEEEDDNPLNVTGETTLSSGSNFPGNIDDDIADTSNGAAKDKKGSKKDGKKKEIFFDIGASFADNNRKHLDLWNDNDNCDDPVLDNHMARNVSSNSLADLSDGDDDSATLNENNEAPLRLPPMLPGPRNDFTAKSNMTARAKNFNSEMKTNGGVNISGITSATLNTTGLETNISKDPGRSNNIMAPSPLIRQKKQINNKEITDDPDNIGWNTLASSNTSFMAQSVEGEVMSFQEMEQQDSSMTLSEEVQRMKAGQKAAEDAKEEALFEAFGDFPRSYSSTNHLQTDLPKEQPFVSRNEMGQEEPIFEAFGAFPRSVSQATVQRLQQRYQNQKESLLNHQQEIVFGDTSSTQNQSQSSSQPSSQDMSKQCSTLSSSQPSSSQRSSKRRPKRGSNISAPSLEEQILSVLQQQPESHVLEEEEANGSGGEDAIEEEEELFGRGDSPILSPPVNGKKAKSRSSRGGGSKGCGSKSGTVGSTASAQDILNELRSSTPCTLQSGSNSLSGSNRSKPPLGSISISGRSQQQKSPPLAQRLQQQHSQGQNSQPGVATQQMARSQEPPNKNAGNNGSGTSTMRTSLTPPSTLLRPSRRDLLSSRPNRISRRSASEPTSISQTQSFNTAANTSKSSRHTYSSTTPPKESLFTGESAAASVNTTTSNGSGSTHCSTKSSPSSSRRDVSSSAHAVTNSADFNGVTLGLYDSADFSELVDADKPESPHERYRKHLLSRADQESNMPVQTTRSNPHRLFPHTRPKVPSTGISGPQQQKSTNPFDSPPRLLETSPPENADDPFEEPSSPIPMDRSTNPFESPPRQEKITSQHGMVENLFGKQFEEQSSPIQLERSDKLQNTISISRSSNPFDSPSQHNDDKVIADDPFKEPSSPIRPLEYSDDSQNEVHISSEPPYSMDESSSTVVKPSNENKPGILDVSSAVDEAAINAVGVQSAFGSSRHQAQAYAEAHQMNTSSSSKNKGNNELSFASDKAITGPWTSASSRREGTPPSALFLAPSKRDTLRATRPIPPPQKTVSPLPQQQQHQQQQQFASSPSSSRGSSDIEQIRASISQLKNNGVGGVGKRTSTLVRNQETGRYVIRDIIDDEKFVDIIAEKMMRPGLVVEKEGGEGEKVKEEDVDGLMIPATRGVESEERPKEDKGLRGQSLTQHHLRTSVDDAILHDHPQTSIDDAISYKPRPPTRRSKPKESTLTSRVETTTPIKFMMTNQIMNESVLDDEAVDVAVQAATECLSITSSATSNDPSIATEIVMAQQQQRIDDVAVKKDDIPFTDFNEYVNNEDADRDDLFVVQKPQQHQGWSAKWSGFESHTDNLSFDDFDIHPSNSMDEWGDSNQDGDGYDCDDGDSGGDGFGDCWRSPGEENANISNKLNTALKPSYFASPTSVTNPRSQIRR